MENADLGKHCLILRKPGLPSHIHVYNENIKLTRDRFHWHFWV